MFNERFSRRRFLKISVLGALGIAANLVQGCRVAEDKEDYNKKEEITSDLTSQILESKVEMFNQESLIESGMEQIITQGMFQNLGGIKVKFGQIEKSNRGEKFGEDSEIPSFRIHRAGVYSKEFKRGEIDGTDNQLIELEDLQVTIDPERFRLGDIPEFVRELEEKHNQFVSELSLDEGSIFNINPAKIIADRWRQTADYLDRFPKYKIFDEKIKTSLDQVIKTFDEIASKFDSEEDFESDIYLEKVVFPQIEKLLIKKRKPFAKRNEALKRLVRMKAKTQLGKADFETAIFERNLKETMRLTGLVDEVENFWKDKALLIEGKMKDWRDILRMAEQEGNVDKITQIQKNIAENINKILFPNNLFEYEEEAFSFNDILERKVNCLSRNVILYAIWREVFGIEILGALTDRHFFTILPLANGEYLSLDFIPHILTDKDGINLDLSEKRFYAEGESNYKKNGLRRGNYWIRIGDFRNFCISCFYVWQAKKFQKEGRRDLADYFYEIADERLR